jgi:hypothetical protein
MLHTDANWKARREMDPVQRLLDIWKTSRNFSIFREHSVPDTFDNATEFAVGMSHQEHVNTAITVDAFQLRFTIVCDHAPGPGVNEREHSHTRMSIRALRNIHVRNVGIERSNDAATFQIEPCFVHLGGRGGTLRNERLYAVNGMD